MAKRRDLISGQPALTTPGSSDLIYIVHDPAGECSSRCITVDNLLYEVLYRPVRCFAPAEAPTGMDPNAIAVGDFLWMSSGVVYGAQWVEDMLTEAANQEFFHDAFAGVALEAYDGTGEGTELLTATCGKFLVPCTSQTWEIGDLVGVKEQPNGTNLYANTVTRVVAAPQRAIGYCVNREPSAVTSVWVSIFSTKVGGGPQLMA